MNDLASDLCVLCNRKTGQRVTGHHMVPVSIITIKANNRTVPMHRICHSLLHQKFTNAELKAMALEGLSVKQMWKTWGRKKKTTPSTRQIKRRYRKMEVKKA